MKRTILFSGFVLSGVAGINLQPCTARDCETNGVLCCPESSKVVTTNQVVIKPLSGQSRRYGRFNPEKPLPPDVEVLVSFGTGTNAAPFTLKDEIDLTPPKLPNGADSCECGEMPPEEPPTPEQIEARFRSVLATAQSIPWNDTDVTNRVRRVRAIKELAGYASTNSLAYLSTVWRNPEDPAQYTALQSAIGVSLEAGGDEWKDIVVEVATNQYGDAPIRTSVVRDLHIRSFEKQGALAAYGILMFDNYRERYATNQVQRAKIAAFIDERLPVAIDFEGVKVDDWKCYLEAVRENTPNPTYCRSQQRRDNLTRARNASHIGDVLGTLEERIKYRYDRALRDAQPQE